MSNSDLKVEKWQSPTPVYGQVGLIPGTADRFQNASLFVIVPGERLNSTASIRFHKSLQNQQFGRYSGRFARPEVQLV